MLDRFTVISLFQLSRPSRLHLPSLCLSFAMLVTLVVASALWTPARAAQTTGEAPVEDLVLPDTPMLLLDVATGRVLYQQQGNHQWYPASLTKLMSAYVIFRAIEAGELSEESAVTVSKHALSYPPSKMGFAVGTKMTVGNALKMMLVKSANDIAAALGERVSGSEAAFAQRMNAEAARLGMHASHFVNANGLFAKGHVSSARDMAILTRHILMDFPQYRYLFEIPAIRHGKRVLRSYNTLLEHFTGANGMKTGFVCSSGYNMVAAANRGGRQLVAVVLGAPTAQVRSEVAAMLLAQGFSRQDMASGAGIPLQEEALFGSYDNPTDLRPQICPKGQPLWHARVKYRGSYMEPKFRLMDPVRVETGIPELEINLPANLAQLPLVGPVAKTPRPVAQQSGDLVRLGQFPRPKPTSIR